ncbi:hypothetical protein GPECTOR_26g585 [Gonium pectorale]|uniref:Uncharacterized protein n=1 Tax=Gonium pectorale TaxID=33097 RepID=A0A150GFR4_GONPE|nr:hypothetical protein GPECTOR_26g585 [Gonium pectorale]|eukprot:KXZ48682.1 hypothetical protein GPECTOR_26g585 [Gonium pectorale]
MILGFTSPAHLAALEYPPLERAVQSYRSMATELYELAGGSAGGLGGATLEQFIWALALGPGGRLCPRLAAALRDLYGKAHGGGSGAQREVAAAAGVARRCVELLSLRAPLLPDLEALAAAGVASESSGGEQRQELGHGEAGRGLRASPPPLTPQQWRLALSYRSYKKMMLWDYVLDYAVVVAAATSGTGVAAETRRREKVGG